MSTATPYDVVRPAGVVEHVSVGAVADGGNMDDDNKSVALQILKQLRYVHIVLAIGALLCVAFWAC